MKHFFMRAGVCLACLPGVVSTDARGAPPLARVTGADFAGGAKDRYGAVYDGEQVNYIYAQPTGALSSMTVAFSLAAPPTALQFLHLRARDDDGRGTCPIEIALNGATIFQGGNAFPEHRWGVKRFEIAPGVLHAGMNELVITNRASIGESGMPPWFMVAGAAVADAGYAWAPEVTRDFFVTLAREVRTIPEPLAEGTEPGFPIRGTKGWMWTPEQYLEQIPYLAEFKMNFLMLCYGSMCDVENIPWGDPRCNRWWEELPPRKKEGFENVVKECQKHGITFCFSMNPNLCSQRPLRYGSEEDFETLWKHYAWMQGLGVKWFNLSLDDIEQGIDASGQAHLINTLLTRLRAKDPGAVVVFTPTRYWGDGTDPESRQYLETLAVELDKDVYLFWTGDRVVGPVTRKTAESYKSIVKHRLILWDNYPVNDDHATMHLGPVIGRDADVCEVLDGYMSNPMRKQNRLNRVPLLTCADYAYNPKSYDPARSIGQSILHLGKNQEQREVLKDLVEAYPGMLLMNGGTEYNPVRAQYARLAGAPHSRYIAELLVRHLEDVSSRMGSAFGGELNAEKRTLDDDIGWVRESMKAKYGQ